MNLWKKGKERKVILFFLLLALSLLIGCSSVIYIDRNHTVYINETINHTIYVYNTTIEPCNNTEINVTIYDRAYVLGMIRQLKRYEDQQDTYYNYNETDCMWELNQSNIKREKAELELCVFWNMSWCS